MSYQLFPSLDAATEAALRASIERFGVLVPVARDQHGNTLDGFHRSRIADELNVSYQVNVHVVADEDEARAIARTLNTDRRHLTAVQRREVVVALRETGRHSNIAIASALGVDEKTVRNDLSGSDYSEPDRVRGRDGKSYPSTRITTVAAKNKREAERVQQALITTELPGVPVLDVKRVERLAREQQAERRRGEPVPQFTADDDITILHGDFAAALEDFDLAGATIITDPPYPREYLPQWESLVHLALGPWDCGQMVLMCGQSILPDVLALAQSAEFLATADSDVERWVYRWCGAYMTAGPAARVWNADVGSSWKPILVFDRGSDRQFLTSDVFTSTGDDKQHHYWGQNEDGIAALVEAFSKPGDLIVDPFLGGGTTAVVCKALGRRFVGCDIDSAAVATARERLAA